MVGTKRLMKIVRQPITEDGCMTLILRPAGFLWTGKRLHIGYAWLSRLHPDEDPVWDRDGLVGTSEIQSMKGISFLFWTCPVGVGKRSIKYAVIETNLGIIPDSYRDDYGRPLRNAKRLFFTERMVLPPGSVCRFWIGDFMKWETIGNERIATILEKARSFRKERRVGGELREQMESIGGHQ
jgi:hypothetical protein